MFFTSTRNVSIAAWALGMTLFLGGCTLKQARVASVALTVQDVAQAAAKQSDPTIVREGMPAYLMLIDGLIEAYPENKDLLMAGCQAYGTYASSFVAEEERDKGEALYRKARQYGFRALTALGKGDFQKLASGNLEDFTAFLGRFKKEDVPILFWTTNAWASWISNNLSSVEALADLAPLEASMKRILELDDTFYHGSPHLLMGVYLAAKPPIMGGDLSKARQHFDRAFALGAGKFLMSKVLYAQYYARGLKDSDLFTRALQDVLAAPVDEAPELTLSNVLAKEKAKRLLGKAGEYFAAQP